MQPTLFASAMITAVLLLTGCATTKEACLCHIRDCKAVTSANGEAATLYINRGEPKP